MSEPKAKHKSLFHVAVTHYDSKEGSTVVVEPKTILATSQEVARLTVFREVPEEYAEKLDELEVVVRPL